MAEDRIENVEIEPLSDEELQEVAGGTETSTPTTSTGPSCCSCSNCSRATSGFGTAEPTIGTATPVASA